MKKIVSLLSLLLTFSIFVLFQNQIVSLADETTVFVHYHRFDQNYDNWDMWLWEKLPTSKDGAAIAFDETDEFGVVAEVPLSALGGYDASKPPTQLGFIIRQNGWDGDREPGGDRFFAVNADANNEVHVYIITGDEVVYTDREDADISPQFASATFNSFKRLNFSTTTPVTDVEAFKDTLYLEENGVKVDIASITMNANKQSGTINLVNNISFEADYNLGSTDYSKLRGVLKTSLFDSTEFEEQYTYTGNDLGATYTKERTFFRVWAPTATDVSVVLYSSGDYRNGSILDAETPTDLIEEVDMTRSEKGTWVLEYTGDLHKTYYTYKVTFGNRSVEAVDPYAFAVGVNGHRGMVVDLDSTDPSNWSTTKPEAIKFNDAVIYELHIRDLSIHSSSGIENKGKYLGLIESGTTFNTTKTGLDHLVDLGITHLHLLPTFDHRSIDETKLDQPQFNWGYDPLNFNVPEGSYSSDPYNGEVRINEFKQMVQGLHDADIRVVMDVVYNHLGDAASSSFEKIVPGYYFRYDANGGYANGSGVGNETASDRAMFRKFMVESVQYWATEYNIDGFRFDLMALHDIETMNQIRTALDAIDPSIIVYGEGWTGGTSPLPESEQALRTNVSKMPGIAVFNDITRDGIKGSVWSGTDKGFVQGNNLVDAVKFGIVGGIEHPGTTQFWANQPSQIINYVEAHDNFTLWDKLKTTLPSESDAVITDMHKQAAAIVLTSQGVPFLHAGQDFLRTKPDGDEFNENSYNAPDRVNQLRWDFKDDNFQVYDYYKGLIALRKAHSAFRMETAEDIRTNLAFFNTGVNNVIGYTISGAEGEAWDKIVVLHNGNTSGTRYVTLPEEGTYNIVVDLARAGTDTIRTFTGDQFEIRANESIVMYLTDDVEVPTTDDSNDGNSIWMYAGIGAGVVLGGLAVVLFLKKRK